jgi:hypothetical protein
MNLAPILLFTYNRPSHTRQTLEALLNNKLAKESELFIFSDGYKNDNDKENVLKVRNIIHSIEGFKQVHIIENAYNFGLAKNIIEGVTQVIDKYGKMIALEDDLITSPYFLTFMNEALEKFENEEKIGHVHAFCYSNLQLPDVFLIKWTGSLGWGTWKRAWRFFNPDGQALLNELKKRNLTKKFDFNGSYPYTRMLRRQIAGINNSWAIRWNASLFLNDMLSVNAGKSLILNIGFDGSGENSGSQDIYKTLLHNGILSTDLGSIEENMEARAEFQRFYRKTHSFWAKVRRRIQRHLKI